jgi:hypothetical protein
LADSNASTEKKKQDKERRLGCLLKI